MARPRSVLLHGERILRVEQGFDATQQFCHAIALWHDCGYAQGSGRGLTKHFVKHCVEDNRSAGQQSRTRRATSTPFALGMERSKTIRSGLRRTALWKASA